MRTMVATALLLLTGLAWVAAPVASAVVPVAVTIQTTETCGPGLLRFELDSGLTQPVTSQLKIIGLTAGHRYWIITGQHEFAGEDVFPDVKVTAPANGAMVITMHSNPVYERHQSTAADLTWQLWDVPMPEPFSMLSGRIAGGSLVKSGTTPVVRTACNVLRSAAGYRASIGSPDGRSTLAMQTDGNLVLRRDGKALWWTSTQKRVGNYAVVQSDGNFVVYSAQNRALWNSHSNSATIRASGQPNTLVLSKNGNLVLRTTQGAGEANYGRAIWQTGTGLST